MAWTAAPSLRRSAPVQRHLQRVYATLTGAVLLSALGCFVDVTVGFPDILSGLGAFGCLVALTLLPASASNRVGHGGVRTGCT